VVEVDNDFKMEWQGEVVVRQVEVVTDIHCYGAGATCSRLGGSDPQSLLYFIT